MSQYINIRRLHAAITGTLCTVNGKLSYSRIQDALIKLCEVINETETDENVWYIGSGGEASLDDLIIGAYWHFCYWHDGKKGYQVLSQLGTIYSPNMETEPEAGTGAAFIFDQLEEMAGE